MISNIPIQIRIPGRKPNRVIADPLSRCWIVPAVGVVLQAIGIVEVARCVVQIDGVQAGRGLTEDVAVDVVGNVVDDRGCVGRVIVPRPVANRVQVIGKCPMDIAIVAFIRQDLVHVRPPKQAMFHCGRIIKLQYNPVAVVDEAG